ncbi:MAG: CpsD/CapB family tyrosine-protein kinase [Lachnospiraceae bacterium]|nr:CpsD/CapB family tyrosine-protein kinase [Lachnospiraceae bacterium]
MEIINIKDQLPKISKKTSEALKVLRTNIQLSGTDIKTIEFTSTFSNEGKTRTSFCLAISLAESGKKVLFLDCDLRNSKLIGKYKVPNTSKGLTQYLSGACDYDDILNETDINNFDVIFSGPVPPNPAELLESEEFSSLVDTYKPFYDYIIVDTPPIGKVIDAVILASKCDGIIFVVGSGDTNTQALRKAKRRIEKTECRILGAVLNKATNGKDLSYGGFSGYGSYGDYGK